ncbi:hypothetical protein Riv7116_6340 [Rivularia sp. PCC 7116]|nr:hypothetical protein Riv7116_6340 [Rivularia sp. PCC 7116]
MLGAIFRIVYRLYQEKQMSNPTNNIPIVDLVIIIDTSPSMKDEARALSNAAENAINCASTSCPTELRVTWFGIEGTWRGTNFNQTIRNYLTKSCNVSDSKLRGRKRGQLKSAGAQEDVARAIEDICDYFDWRENAARAIFCLGDEALEGGGEKTEREDIEAANLAIQTAKVSKVTVHTYCGISKSKFQEGIKREYQRIASETGGQFFTDEDSIQGFNAVLEKVICGSNPVTVSQNKASEKTNLTVEMKDDSTTNQPQILATGLEDYAYWIKTVAKEQAGKDNQKKDFRRGRIWA